MQFSFLKLWLWTTARSVSRLITCIVYIGGNGSEKSKAAPDLRETRQAPECHIRFRAIKCLVNSRRHNADQSIRGRNMPAAVQPFPAPHELRTASGYAAILSPRVSCREQSAEPQAASSPVAGSVSVS